MPPSDSLTLSPRKRGNKKQAKKPRLSRLQKPEGMSLEQWQLELRKQSGQEQKFKLVCLGEHPVFSDFHVTNPQSGNTYRVRIRGPRVGDNACTCPDFATNTLGSCKHIEFTLAKLKRKHALRAQPKAGHQPAYSELYLQYGSRREVRFRPGSECRVELARLAANYFDETGALRPEAVAKFETFLEEANQFDPDLDCGDDVLAYVAELRDAERRKELIKEAFSRGIRIGGMGPMRRQLYAHPATSSRSPTTTPSTATSMRFVRGRRTSSSSTRPSESRTGRRASPAASRRSPRPTPSC